MATFKRSNSLDSEKQDTIDYDLFHQSSNLRNMRSTVISGMHVAPSGKGGALTDLIRERHSRRTMSN